jgi:hypothetical protein
VSAKRMNREQFFRVVSGLDEDRLRKALWNLYWRGTANMRERIEVELASDGRGRPSRPAKETAARQLIRWESRYGWTRHGQGPVAAKEASLAVVLARMLRISDTWEGFAEQYVRALDALRDRAASTRQTRRFAKASEERSRALAEWHGLLQENLADTEGGLLDGIAGHAALGGPEQTFLSARLAHRRGNTDVARDLTAQCLQKLPGHNDFREFAAEIGAAAPG